MLVCHCNSVCEKQIRSTIRSGARCLDDVERACGAGGGCGGCSPAVEEILEHELQLHRASALPPDPLDALELLIAPT